ncbi:MAG: hypothetical protein GWP05_05385 [Anaerolineaceae bacterium]|nr:hypothetical protein [Anaerolineaceae bacterium]
MKASAHNLLVTSAVAVAIGAALCAFGLAADTTEKAPPGQAGQANRRPVIVIFDFDSPANPGLGTKLSERLRLRAARLGRLTLIDVLSLKQMLAPGEAPTLETKVEVAAKLTRQRFAAELALWGRVTRAADGAYTLDVAGLDLREGAARPILRKVYRAAKPQLVNARCDQVLTDLTGLAKAKRFREADPEAAARARVRRENLVANGGFELLKQNGVDPQGWQRVDGLTIFVEKGDGDRGRVLHLDTDVYESQYKQWIQKFKAGDPASAAPKKTPTTGAKYNTVAGIYGVHVYSDPIPVIPGRTYRLRIDYRGKSTGFFFPKLFFRGWADVEGDQRIVYDGYLSLRSLENTEQWKRNLRLLTVPRPEEIQGRKIKYLKLMIYAYWPPGDYYFDNVALHEVVILKAKPQGKH